MRSEMPTGPELIAQVTTGMRVVDAAGAELGRVVHVATGDPAAVVVQEPPGADGVLDARLPNPARGDEPEVAPDIAARLLRVGYLKVGCGGRPGRECYVNAEQIARVRQDVVELAVTGGELVTASS